VNAPARRIGRDREALSTLATQPNEALSWKQEVNQRLAAHKSRRDSGAAEVAESAGALHSSNPRAAQAAARVAARYAQAPSYSQLLADEARAAVRAAEAASQAALKAQAAAESVLAEIETAASSMPMPQPMPAPTFAREACPVQTTFFDPFLEVERPVAQFESEPAEPALAIRWEADLPVRPSGSGAARSPRRREEFASALEDWQGDAAAFGEPETVEPALLIHANLIEFPRELVATRKARPRIAEGPLAPEGGLPGQLSIFEVDPGAISIMPEQAMTAVETVGSGWSRIRLDAEPDAEPGLGHAHEAAGAWPSHQVQLAPIGLRLLSAVVDAALIGAAFFATTLAAAPAFSSHPSIKSMELAAAAGLVAIGVLYQAFFFTFAEATPGMRYAGISLCNLEDERPAKAQLRLRVGALILSLLPVGLGLLWAIFDEDHLSWHDRISRTYQR
jgi:uncharacterized RDD family membrane protein YckC